MKGRQKLSRCGECGSTWETTEDDDNHNCIDYLLREVERLNRKVRKYEEYQDAVEEHFKEVDLLLRKKPS